MWWCTWTSKLYIEVYAWRGGKARKRTGDQAALQLFLRENRQEQCGLLMVSQGRRGRTERTEGSGRPDFISMRAASDPTRLELVYHINITDEDAPTHPGSRFFSSEKAGRGGPISKGRTRPSPPARGVRSAWKGRAATGLPQMRHYAFIHFKGG